MTARTADGDRINDYAIYQHYNYPVNTATGIATGVTAATDLEYGNNQSYPSWCTENEAPVTVDDIWSIFERLGEIFGFQKDNLNNIFDFLMTQLDSRSSRMSCHEALLSLHIDYIGGENANYKKWYFVAHYELDESLKVGRKQWKYFNSFSHFKRKQNLPYNIGDLEDQHCLLAMEYRWRDKMKNFTSEQYIEQIALYLLIWGEANNVRFMPECLCFIFKCALDYLQSIEGEFVKVVEYDFLDHVITPLYCYIRDQQYEATDRGWKKKEKDHSDVIGYDDVNQFFWFLDNLKNIKLDDSSLLYDLPRTQRYGKLKNVNWQGLFYKTYRERRTWLHLFTNFSRVWIIHITMFWYYTCFNSPTLYTKNYNQLLDNKPPAQVQLSAVSLGGAVACVLAILATIGEWFFIPRRWPDSHHAVLRLLISLVIVVVNVAPSVFIFLFLPLDEYSKEGHIISALQFVISILTFLYFAMTPPKQLFSFLIRKNSRIIKTEVFTSSFPRLELRNQVYSYLLWAFVFLAKFSESYFFLTLSVRDPVRVLSIMEISRCRGDVLLGTFLCRQQARFTMVLLYITDLVLFFLDTYLWYVLINCFFSVGLSFSLGISIFTPWRNIFARLPDRIMTKISYIDSEVRVDAMLIVSQIWNSIILSMYREHLLSIEQVNKLVYQQISSRNDYSGEKSFIRSPLFFIFQDDNSVKMHDFFTTSKEAERRISFFAQSLSCPLPEPIPIMALPSFTVLVPHYSEKIILNLKEIIKEDKKSKVSQLEYLKKLHKTDWELFVEDTKLLTLISSQQMQLLDPDDEDEKNLMERKENSDAFIRNEINNLPYYCIGFKDSSPEYTLRTRIWSSLRSQTLYRTVSGFMNYEKALKLLYKLENYDFDSVEYLDIEEELNQFAHRKFRLLISMQRYQHFNEEELKNASLLFGIYPQIQVAYLEEEYVGDKTEYYSTLLDVTSKNDDGSYNKKYRVKLSGNPILGDGKSDNQNNSVIYYRGEYIQVIDANQDNYLEECLKIKSVLTEFEEITKDTSSEYIPGILLEAQKDPVAILGAREYIFSENIGVLGDIAAGKEQTFGTLFARTLSEIGGKLHYGHPDFLNGIFMTMRGGLSKAQKGLHLNEDIYAGMSAVCRGGRIKHCDYYQCGKGRDLGFGTILNFTTKIGAGMGEQLLSREYYYLGTYLPVDRFLSFYYAHAGFHINNLFIMLSVQLFMLFLVNMGSLANESIICNYDPDVPFTDVQRPLGCYNLQPVLNWVSRFVLSVFICFFISFVPLILQELIERGFIKAFFRIFRHFVSLAPFFEVFVCQIYAKSLKDNIIFGGAKYIATGRGFATSRLSFSLLYSRYASMSIYSGFIVFLIFVFACLSMWQPSLLWFCITCTSTCLAPFIFNPHQFSFGDFFVDYRDYLKWLSKGSGSGQANSWISYIRQHRAKHVGYKKVIIDKNEKLKKTEDSVRRPSRWNSLANQVLIPIVSMLCYIIPYMFINSQNGVQDPEPVNPLMRILILSLFPSIVNVLVLLTLFVISCTIVPLMSLCCRKFPNYIANIAKVVAVVINIINIEVLCFTEGWNITRTLCGLICMLAIQKTLLKTLLSFFLTRELVQDHSNRAWWSGKWITSGLGWLLLSQPLREFVVKVYELNFFAYDFLLGHFLLFVMSPILFIPFVDRWHSKILFWLNPSKQFREPILSKREKKRRLSTIIRYMLLFFIFMITFISLIVIPILADIYIPDIRESVPVFMAEFIQPNHQNNNDTGEFAPAEILINIPVDTDT